MVTLTDDYEDRVCECGKVMDKLEDWGTVSGLFYCKHCKKYIAD